MATGAVMPAAKQARALIAPLWHTGLLLAILAALAAAGAVSQRRSTPSAAITAQHPNVIPVYCSVIFLEAALVWFVWSGARRKGTTLRALIGGKWGSIKSVAVDFVLAACFWVVWEGAARLMHLVLGPDSAKSINPLLPQGPVEVILWIFVSCCAGFAEELVYRGYLQRQMQALTGSITLAVLVQGLLFGVSHAYQGAKQVVIITVLGLLYGVLPVWRRSLRPNMLAHAWSDVFGGIISR